MNTIGDKQIEKDYTDYYIWFEYNHDLVLVVIIVIVVIFRVNFI